MWWREENAGNWPPRLLEYRKHADYLLALAAPKQRQFCLRELGDCLEERQSIKVCPLWQPLYEAVPTGSPCLSEWSFTVVIRLGRWKGHT